MDPPEELSLEVESLEKLSLKVEPLEKLSFDVEKVPENNEISIHYIST